MIATRLGPDPFRWRLSGQLSASVKVASDGSLDVPLTENYLRADLPNLGPVRFRGELTFNRQSDAGWYGLGNASPAGAPDDLDWRYIRTSPAGRLELWEEPRPGVRIFEGLAGGYSWIDYAPDSRLADDAGALVGATDHGLVEGFVGAMIDTRDNEFWPVTGMLHDASVRGGTVFGGARPYAGFDVAVRGYLGTPKIILAGQMLGDVVVGDVPFYELARHGGAFPAYGPGGQFGPRGVPLHRYHGAAKVLGNVELRTMLVPFHLFDLRWEVGPLVFFDVGRVWAGLEANPALDGEGLGLHYGTGGGLRLRMGEAVVVRGDVGWSPEGLGIYLDMGNVF